MQPKAERINMRPAGWFSRLLWPFIKIEYPESGLLESYERAWNDTIWHEAKDCDRGQALTDALSGMVFAIAMGDSVNMTEYMEERDWDALITALEPAVIVRKAQQAQALK